MAKFVFIFSDVNHFNMNLEKPKCEFCDKCYSTKDKLTRHIKLAHKLREDKFKCEACSNNFQSKVALRIHKKSFHEEKEKFTRNICDTSFPRKGALKTHLEFVHDGNKIYKRKDISTHHQKNVQCKYCEKIFNKQEFKLHVKVLINYEYKTSTVTCKTKLLSRDNSSTNMQAGTEIPGKFICDICEKIFLYSDNLKTHFKLLHERFRPFKIIAQKILERKYKCESCDNAFKTKTTLRRHNEQVHQKVNGSVCHICSKAFTSKSYLKLHLRVFSLKFRILGLSISPSSLSPRIFSNGL